jgi:NitT/TauT family transport system permease protein
VLILGIWEAAYRLVGWREWIFPAPSHVADAVFAMLSIETSFGEPVGPGWPGAFALSISNLIHSDLPSALLTSCTRLIVGFAISIVLGATFGLTMWRSRSIDEMLGPLFLGLQTLPSVCWVPLAILLPTLGLSERGILFVLVMGSFFAIAIGLRDGLRAIPPVYQRAGLMLGARGWRMYRYVLLPASLPALASSLRQGFSFAWRSLMGAELIFVVHNRGLGFLLAAGREYADIAQVVAVMAAMVTIGILVDRFGFARVERQIYSRLGLGARGSNAKANR